MVGVGFAAPSLNDPSNWWCYCRDGGMDMDNLLSYPQRLIYNRDSHWFWKIIDICVPVGYENRPSEASCQAALLDLYMFGKSSFPYADIELNVTTSDDDAEALLYECGNLFYFVPLGESETYQMEVYLYGEEENYHLRLVFDSAYWVYDASTGAISSYGYVEIYDVYTNAFLGRFSNDPYFLSIFF